MVTKREAIAKVAAAWALVAPRVEARHADDGVDGFVVKLAEAIDDLLDSEAADLFVEAVREAQPADAGTMARAAAIAIAQKWLALAASLGELAVLVRPGEAPQPVASLAEASRLVVEERDRLFVGSNEWSGWRVGAVSVGGHAVAEVSYNGRVWWRSEPGLAVEP